jgi:hypothetical protein
MAAVTDTAGRRWSDRTGQPLPPRRGEPYYSERHGGLRVVPPEGGKAVPFVPGRPPAFDPAGALRAAGLAADRAASAVGNAGLRGAQAVAGEAASPFAGTGAMLVTVLGSLLGLILLELFLGPRAPLLVQRILGAVSGGIRRLVSPADPLIAKTPPGPNPTATPAATAGKGGSATGLSGKPAAAYPAMAPAGGNPAVPGYPHLRAAAQADVRHVDVRILAALDRLASTLGQTVTVFSGYRDPTYSAAHGGYATDPHTRGVAVDAEIGSTPIGDYPGAFALLGKLGLESGAQPDFYRGQRDPAHVQIPGSGVNKSITASRWLG